jgi:hypothetical protein
MRVRVEHVLVILGLLFAHPVFSQASNGNSPVLVPDGTTVDTIKYGVDKNGQQRKDASLKPAEQVAFLFVYNIWELERDYAYKDSGLGRLCSLRELVKGVRTRGGQTIGLAEDPARDTNYRYSMTLIGDSYMIIMALPRSPGLAGFALVGTPDNDDTSWLYYNPKGSNLELAKKIYSINYKGDGFKRVSAPTQTAPAQIAVSAPAQTSAFFELVKTGTPQSIQAAIDKGADVNAVYGLDGTTALMLAAEDNPDADVVAALLKAGAEIEARDEIDRTALMFAAEDNPNPDVIAALLKAGAEIEARDDFGYTALIRAAGGNPNSTVIAELLKAGADGKAKDNAGLTAFDNAKNNKRLQGTDALRQLEEASK